MKNKILTLVLITGLVITSGGWALSNNDNATLTETVNIQEVDLNKKSTEIANLENVIVEKDNDLKSRDMVIEEQQISINKQKKKIQYLEDNIEVYNKSTNIEEVSVSRSKSDVLYSLTVNASAYIAFCDTGCTGITATGYDVRNTIYYYDGLRVIATDPKVIPMYSIVEIEGFEGRFIAVDTGGAIKGNKIDILVESTKVANKFGRKDLKIDVIRKGR